MGAPLLGGHQARLSGGTGDGVAVTPSDTTADPNGPFRGFHVGVAGDVKVTSLAGNAVVYKNCIAGMLYPYGITRVWSAGTTATDIVGLK